MDEQEALRRAQAVQEQTRRKASQALPGRRDALKPGTLQPTHQVVQADENRDPDRPVSEPPGLVDRETVIDHLRKEPRRK
jgi:hypothetical protein